MTYLRQCLSCICLWIFSSNDTLVNGEGKHRKPFKNMLSPQPALDQSSKLWFKPSPKRKVVPRLIMTWDRKLWLYLEQMCDRENFLFRITTFEFGQSYITTFLQSSPNCKIARRETIQNGFKACHSHQYSDKQFPRGIETKALHVQVIPLVSNKLLTCFPYLPLRGSSIFYEKLEIDVFASLLWQQAR